MHLHEEAREAGWTDEQILETVAHVSLVEEPAVIEPVAAALSALAVEPLPSRRGADDAFVANTVYRLQELTAQRRIAEVKSRLQRTNPVDQATDYNRMFGELVALEQHRRSLRERALENQ